MTLHSIALFLHIVGALLLFVLLTVEGYGLHIGRPVARFNQVVGPASGLFILVPGLYMVATGWGWKGWILVGIASWVLVAALGAVTGVMLLRGRLSLRAANVSWSVRVGMAVGIVFLMSVKPYALVAAGAVLLGAAVGLAASAIAVRQVQSA